MIFFRYGEDDFQIQKDCHQGLPTSPQIFAANETDWSTISTELNNTSLFQTTKVVIINNPFSAKNATIIDGLIDLLEAEVIINQSGTTLLINEERIKIKFQAGQKQPVLLDLEGRGKPLTKVQQKLYQRLTTGQAKYYPRLTGQEAERLLGNLAKEKNSQLTAAASQLLLQLTNYNFWQISHELNKLINYQASINQKQPIEESLVRLLVNDTSDHLFELIEAISDQKLATATKLLEEVLTDETDLVVSANLLSRQALQLLRIKASLDGGQSRATVERSLGLPPMVSQKMVNRAERLSATNLRQLIANLTRFDWSSKRSRGNLLSLFVLLLINHGNQR